MLSASASLCGTEPAVLEVCLCYIRLRTIHRPQALSHDSLTTTKGGTVTTVLLGKELSLRDAQELQGKPLPVRGRGSRPSAGPRASLRVCEGGAPGHAPLCVCVRGERRAVCRASASLCGGGSGPSARPRGHAGREWTQSRGPLLQSLCSWLLLRFLRNH